MWLLNHCPDERPTAQELLESGYVPPKIEDSQLEELLKHTLNQTNSTRYQRMMATLFNQPTTDVSDQIYDFNLLGKSQENIAKTSHILKYVKDNVEKTFLKHGGIFVETPLLVPKSKLFENLRNVTTFIDHSGTQLCLPYNSRLSFARYISRNNINNLRRYYFGKLYHDQKIHCSHPVAIWECCFDIVTESHSVIIPVVELIFIVMELVKEFPQTSQRNFYIQINHSDILKAIFIQNNFSEELRRRVLEILSSPHNKKNLLDNLKSIFMESELQDHIIARILHLFEFQGSLHKAKDVFQGLRKTKANISNLVKHAFSELERVIVLLNKMELSIPVNLCTSLTSSSSYQSGITFQVVAENAKKKKRGGLDIFAVGGCYNQLVESFSKYAETSVLPTAVGVSIAVEKLLSGVAEELKEEGSVSNQQHNVVVYSTTNNVEMLMKVYIIPIYLVCLLTL